MNASKKSRKPVLFVVCDNKLYIKIKYAGMHILCLMLDGVTFTLFGRGRHRTPCLDIDTAIQWHEKEFANTGQKHNQKFAGMLREAKQRFEAEEASRPQQT